MTVEPPRHFRGIFRQDVAARSVYAESAGIQRIEPLAVAVPADTDDLQALVEWSQSSGASLIPRGSGSSMGGAAIGPGVIVDLSRWKAIDLARLDEQMVTVGPGAVCNDVNDAVKAAGLRVAVDPSSAAFCSIGGMTGTNAAGAHTLAFGSTRRWIQGIECLFADGSRAWLRRGERPDRVGPIDAALAMDRSRFARAVHPGVRKESSGYGTAAFGQSGDLVDLMVGSEGTLAFFSKVQVRLAPLPGGTASVMGVFASLSAATDAAIRAREAGAVACELLDKTFLDFVATASERPFGPATEAILLAEVEGESATAALAAASMVAASFAKAGATETRIAASEKEGEVLWALRHAASPTLARLSPHLKSMQFIEDGAVAPERLGDYVTGVRAALDHHRIRGVIFGHAGDANVHVNPLIDPRVTGWRESLEGLLNDVTDLVASLDGTISGEHGDGRIRTPLMDRVWSQEAREGFAQVKRTFDPAGVLNPGVKTAPAATRYAIKYDLQLPTPSAAAAEALSEVERRRAYSSFRLDLLDRA